MPHLNKRLGQHFLKDPHVCQRMVRELVLDASDNILEIGPGGGALTNVLETCPHAHLVLLEKDPAWAQERQKNAAPKTQCVLQDALTFAFSRLPPNWTIVGNLPYNIASPLIWQIVRDTRAPKQALFMVQKEVADRLCAHPGTKTYGALSVWVQNFLTPRALFTIPPQAFVPPPKVDSRVVAFSPLANPLPYDLHTPTKELLDLCFQKRRKQLATIFTQANRPELTQALLDMGLAPSLRPECLTPEAFRALAAKTAG